MKIEVRTDNSVKITGYVNAVERESKPVATPKGMVNELVESVYFIVPWMLPMIFR